MKSKLEYTALVSSYIILCGVIKFYIYYKIFGIMILPFVEMQEILTLFLENIIAYLAIAAFVISHFYLIFKDNTEFNNWSYLDTFKYIKSIWYLLAFCLIFIIVYFYKNGGVDLRDLFLLISILLFFFAVSPYLFVLIIRKFNITKTDTTLIFLLVLLMSCGIANGVNEARKVNKKQNVFYGAQIKLKGHDVLVSNDCLTLVGLTKNYVFIYYKYSKFSMVYKMEDIEFIKFLKY